MRSSFPRPLLRRWENLIGDGLVLFHLSLVVLLNEISVALPVAMLSFHIPSNKSVEGKHQFKGHMLGVQVLYEKGSSGSSDSYG